MPRRLLLSSGGYQPQMTRITQMAAKRCYSSAQSAASAANHYYNCYQLFLVCLEKCRFFKDNEQEGNDGAMAGFPRGGPVADPPARFCSCRDHHVRAGYW